MIDYEKLKLAHEICMKSENYSIKLTLGITEKPELFLRYADDDGNNPALYHMNSIDDLLSILNKLTKTKPKYEVGQTVWLIDCDDICTAKIVKYENEEYRITDCISVSDGFESGKQYSIEHKLYSSKKDLIEAQINYWASLKNEEKSTQDKDMSTESTDCKHEYNFLSGFKCIKCDHQSISNCTYTKPLDEEKPHMSVKLNDGQEFKATAFELHGSAGGGGGCSAPVGATKMCIETFCQHETTQGGCGGDGLYKCYKCGVFYR